MKKIILFIIMTFFVESIPANQKEYVILLHGLARTSKSMENLQTKLVHQNYTVLNFDYNSRYKKIEDIAKDDLKPAIKKFCKNKNLKVNFVTHSLGGIVVRYYLDKYGDNLNMGRLVMLAPPNKGSEVVDFLRKSKIIKSIMGPSFTQLSTDTNSFVNTLAQLDCDYGIIAGNKSVNYINSMHIQGIDDGKVSIENTRLDNMKNFLVVERTHPFIMKAPEVINQVLYFLKKGSFNKS